MFHEIIRFFSLFPPALATFLMGASPILELRLALPVAILHYHFPVWKAVFFAVLGNGIPTLAILLFADEFHHWVEKNSGFFGRHWVTHVAKAQQSFAKYEKYGLWGIFFFISSSLPGTGAYSGAIAAFILGIPIKKSWPYIFGGLLISSVITALVTVGVDKII